MTVGWSALDIALTDQAGQVLGIEADTRARRWPLRLAWTLAAVDLALLAPVLALALLNRHAPDVWKLAAPFQLVTAVVYGVGGGLLAARRTGNAIGWLFLAIGPLAQIGALAAR